MTDKVEELTKEEFCRRFRERMIQRAGAKFDDGASVAEYADEMAPTYWATKWQRDEGPEACADADMSYWGED